MLTYCQYVLAHPEDELNRFYHDNEYGFPLKDDNQLFERLVLEINQAGLNWTLILKKKEYFINAYQDFDISKVAKFDNDDFLRLMSDQGIIRNRLKINAAIENAKVILNIQKEFGSFRKWMDLQANLPFEAWVKLFKKTFKFTGEQIVKEFLLSTGYISGAHNPECPVYEKILLMDPPWMKFRT